MAKLIDKQSILKSFNQPEERLLLAKVLDQADFSLRRKEIAFSDFIDPKKSAFILDALKKVRDLTVVCFGGMADCERRVFGFCPNNMEVCEKDFPLCALQITYHKKFSQSLTHRDYLGSILGLGIDRGKIGDILVLEEETICFVKEEIAEFITSNLYKVSHTKVFVKKILVEEAPIKKLDTQEKRATVPSLRLDAVLGAAFHLSRSKVQALIQSEKVFVNWSVENRASLVIKEGDTLTLRGYGRIRLLEIGGKTKKDRISIYYELFGTK